MLTKEKILVVTRPLKTEYFFVQELGDSIVLRELNGQEREEIGFAVKNARTAQEEINAKMLILEHGIAEPKMNFDELKNAYTLQYSWMHDAHVRILMMSGLAPTEAEKLGKNSQGVLSGKPGSSSPAPQDSLPASSSSSGAAPSSANG